MRTRRLIPWLILALGALAVLEGLGWVTWRSLTLERRERQARAESSIQESLRLALWRMESELTPLIAQESARPYFHYLALYPAQHSYDAMWDPPAPSEVLVPSPLLEPPGSYIRLHYQIARDGTITSPQYPEVGASPSVSSVYLDREYTMIAQQRLDELRAMMAPRHADLNMPEKAVAEAAHAKDTEFGAMPPPGVDPLEWPQRSHRLAEQSSREFEARQQAAENAYGQQQIFPNLQRTDSAHKKLAMPPLGRTAGAASNAASQAKAEHAPETFKAEVENTERPEAPASRVKVAPFAPRWLARDANAPPELVLEREVSVDATTVTQGAWIDWPALRTRLLGQIRNLLPNADLIPYPGRSAPESQRLASIPALLQPGALAIASDTEPNATRLILIVTWFAVLASIGAIAYVLRQSLDLSERRGRFVSAVTHELRTPLTTFTLYTEMLERDIITDETTRRQYLGTLHGESRRLSGLVENVLAFARLGPTVPRSNSPAITLHDLLARVEPAIRRSAESHGLTLSIEPSLNDPYADLAMTLRADPASVERILLNLVENAGKYAGDVSDRRVHLRWAVASGRVRRGVSTGIARITIADHGPGIPSREARAIFAPFYRSRREEAAAKPGLGLGLALARGLARELGGDLDLDRHAAEGAAFTLTLPLDAGDSPSPALG